MTTKKRKEKITISLDSEVLRILLDYAGDRGRGEFISRLILSYHERRKLTTAGVVEELRRLADALERLQ
jgi:hypothetical protein